MSPEHKAAAKNIIFSISPEFSKYDPNLYSDISFLKGIIEEELYILIEELRNGNVRNVRKINNYFIKNPNAIYKIDEAAKKNSEIKEDVEESDMLEESYIKKSKNIIEKLVKLSDFLDFKKLHKEADIVDKLISFASEEDDEKIIDFLEEKSKIKRRMDEKIKKMKEETDTIYDIRGTFSDTVDKYEFPEDLLIELYDSGMEVKDFIQYLQDKGRGSDLNKIYVETLE